MLPKFLTRWNPVTMVRAASGKAGFTWVLLATPRVGSRIMADDKRDESDHGNRSAEEAALSARLQRLGERLDQQGARREGEAGYTPRSEPSAFARGLLLSTELVAGVIVGAIMGWAKY